MAKLSFIIPVFNSVSSLPRLISSLLKQDKECEFLFGVEPSNDGSLEYLESQAKLDDRIKVVKNQACLGPLDNRVNLIRLAKGEFVAFADADDYLKEDFSKVALSCFDEDIDALNVGYFVEYKGKISKGPLLGVRSKLVSGTKACKILLNDISIRGFLWNKVFRKGLFHNDVLLLKGKFMFEDTPLVYSLFSKARKVKLIPTPLYVYVKGDSSLTSSKNKDRARNHINSFALIKYYSTRLGYPYNKDFASSYPRIYLSLLLDFHLSRKAGLNKKEKKELKKKLRMLKGKDFPCLEEFSSSLFPLESIFDD